MTITTPQKIPPSPSTGRQWNYPYTIYFTLASITTQQYTIYIPPPTPLIGGSGNISTSLWHPSVHYYIQHTHPPPPKGSAWNLHSYPPPTLELFLLHFNIYHYTRIYDTPPPRHPTHRGGVWDHDHRWGGGVRGWLGIFSPMRRAFVFLWSAIRQVSCFTLLSDP